MRTKVTVISAGAVGVETARILAARDAVEVIVADDPEQVSGSHVVVCGGAEAGVLDAVAGRAPASVVVVVAGPEECRSVLAGTLFAPSKVIGAPGSAGAVAGVVEAVALDRRAEYDCLVAVDGAYVEARARLGARGVEAIL